MNTNKFLLALVLIMGALFPAQAQRHSIGPTIGINFTDLANVDYNTSFQPGLNVGLIYNYSKHENFGFGTGLRFSQEGAKLDGIDGYSRLNYLRIPLKFQYFFGQMDDRLRPKIYAGPSVGFLIGGKQKVQIGELVVEDDIDLDDYNTIDLGLMGGVGFNYELKESVWLNLDIAYNHGLTDIAAGDGKATNKGVVTKLGIAWGF